ncbi:MAG: hypothetical protein HN406_00060 [Lentisphaerae bacterium]|nr:hypothetical protein [Lentisphaerota bacterium]
MNKKRQRLSLLLPLAWGVATSAAYTSAYGAGRLLHWEWPMLVSILIGMCLLMWPYAIIEPLLSSIGLWEAVRWHSPACIYLGIPILLQLCLWALVGHCIDRRRNRQQIDGEGLGIAGAPPSPSS